MLLPATERCGSGECVLSSASHVVSHVHVQFVAAACVVFCGYTH